MFNSFRRLQSAMEYLMTYGWAILVIAVVIGALYQLGVFNSGTLGGSSCLATSGFLCQNPIINTSGYLGVTFGQIGTSSIMITAVACTSNTTTPSSTQSINVRLLSGQTSALPFSCPLASNSIGSTFKGYLWLVYSTSLQSGIVDRVAIVSGKVSTTGNVTNLLGGVATIPFSATCGGTLIVSGGNDICTFTSNGIFEVTGGSGSVAALVVAGGGGGGSSDGTYGGGGGAGGYQYVSSLALSTMSYSITVGGGGAGGASGGYSGQNGGDSTFNSITSTGGGGGGSGGGQYACATSGGSGGGGGFGGCSGGAGGGIAGQGNNGGNGGSGTGGGGGGGAGAAGNGGYSGSGGVGTSSSISGSAKFYSGGGGGAPNGAGGNGGGANGGSSTGNSATANTGGGGGGGGSYPYLGGNGGSGTVIIIYNALGKGTP